MNADNQRSLPLEVEFETLALHDLQMLVGALGVAYDATDEEIRAALRVIKNELERIEKQLQAIFGLDMVDPGTEPTE